MSATFLPQPDSGFSPECSKACQVFILCEDLAAYRHAAEVCKLLLAQFDTELDFGFNCWNFNELADSVGARSAMKIASQADIILLSLREAEMPPVLEWWLETLPQPRMRNPGALALVLGEGGGDPAQIEQLCTRLEQSARHLGLDFVPLFPAQSLSAQLPFQAAARPGQFTDPPNLEHWGLNE